MNSKRAKEKQLQMWTFWTSSKKPEKLSDILPCEFKSWEDDSEDCCERVRTEEEGAIPKAAEVSSPVEFGAVLLMSSRMFLDY